jgi:transposase-like protein
MSTTVPPEIKAKILSAIKDDGVLIADAAKTYNLHPDTIRKWIAGTADNAGSSSAEITRLRRENQSLKEIIGTLILEKESSKKNITRS